MSRLILPQLLNLRSLENEDEDLNNAINLRPIWLRATFGFIGQPGSEIIDIKVTKDSQHKKDKDSLRVLSRGITVSDFDLKK